VDSPEGVALAARARKASTGMLPDEYMERIVELYRRVAREK
jgi:hypothetical protein